MIGNGKPITRLSRLMVSVFFMITGNQYEVNSDLKFAKPTHGLPLIPLMKSYFLNAMMMPYIGLYANKNRITSAGSIIR